MNGAIAEPLANTISTPNISKVVINGSSQNFLRSRKKPHMSIKKFIIVPFYSVGPG